MTKDQFCPLTEAKCLREDCVCFDIIPDKEAGEMIEKPYCHYFRVYLRK